MIKEISGCYRGMKLVGVIILVFLNLSLFSNDALCAPPLSRDKAAALIEKSISKVKIEVMLHNNGYQKGLQQGMWNKVVIGNMVKGIGAELTERGSQFFQTIYYERLQVYVAGQGPGSVVLKKPVNIRLKVTGIRGNVAEFTWEYVGLPSIVKRYVVRGGMGAAQFTLYDDGWRLTSLNYDYSSEAAPLTAKERAEEVQDVLKAEEQKRIQEEQEQELKLNKRRRLAKLMEESIKPTKEIADFKFHRTYDGRYGSGTVDTILKISDVGIMWEQETNDTDKRMIPYKETKELYSGEAFFLQIYEKGEEKSNPVAVLCTFNSYSGPPTIRLDRIVLQPGTDNNCAFNGNYELSVSSSVRDGSERGVSVFSNSEDIRNAFETLSSIYKQWTENNKEVAELKKGNPLLFKQHKRLLGNYLDPEWEKFD